MFKVQYIVKQKFFSGCLAFFAIVGLFFALHTFRDGRQAYAFSPLVSGSELGGGVHYSAFQRRVVRRELMRDMDGLFDLRGRDVRAVFSQPELVRQDEPMVIWQYRSADCVLDLYFSSVSAGAEIEPVAHYELRARKVGAFEEVGASACLSSLIQV